MHPSRSYDRLPCFPSAHPSTPARHGMPLPRRAGTELLTLALRQRCRTPNAALSRYVWSAKWLRDVEPAAAKAHDMTLSQLMVRAGTAAFQVVLEAYPTSAHWLILVGSGNNGGDGYVMATLAKQAGKHVTVVAMPTTGLPVEAATAKCAWERIGGTSVTYDAAQGPPAFPPVCSAGTPGVDVVVDGLLGTGIGGAPREGYAQLIEQINQLPVPRVAIDIPSGLNAETGAAPGACVRADHTVAFISLKPGLLTGQARAFTGQLHYDTLGLEDWLQRPEQRAASMARRLSAMDLPHYFPAPRDEVSHKGRNGKVLLVGGDSGFGGAILLAAEACLASGAGLTRVLTRPAHLTPLLTRCPEVMVEGVDPLDLLAKLRAALEWCSTVAIGPGLGTSASFGVVALREVLQHCRRYPNKPLVIDADGLNSLVALQAEDDVFQRSGSFELGHSVITPHPGEASRLLRCSILEIEKDRVASAQRLAALVGGTCLLKGPGTIVLEHHRSPFAVLDAGNAGMAVGGMGDVLTGVIASLAAQGVATPPLEEGDSPPKSSTSPQLFHATCAGGLVHAVAADFVKETVSGRGTRGLRPTDVMPYITTCVNISENRW